MTAPGLIIAAPSSGSGKTLVSLGIMAALKRRGRAVAAAKVGPDYIDPAFHQAATGAAGTTLDGWAMSPAQLALRVTLLSAWADPVICEGVMGLLDGADVPVGEADGSTADIAALTGWPVVLVVDAARMAGSAAAVVSGFAAVRTGVRLAGVVFNRVGSDRHKAMIERAMQRYCPAVGILGFLPHLGALAVPSRHLGLVQAIEHPDLNGFIEAAAAAVERHLDLDRLLASAGPANPLASSAFAMTPLGQRIAVAQDAAFAFSYDHLLSDWRRQGAEILPFSPLADQGPGAACDAVFLPGGYPELFVGALAAEGAFKAGLRNAAARGAFVHAECGGYMALGEALIDQKGQSHPMAGLLPVVTSMENPKRHLGYRRALLRDDTPLGAAGAAFRGHEFHYAVEISRKGVALFDVFAADGKKLCDAGCRVGGVQGSFMHIIAAENMGL